MQKIQEGEKQMKEEKKEGYFITEVVEELKKRGYSEATLKRVKYYTAKRYIYPARLHPGKKSSNYLYSQNL